MSKINELRRRASDAVRGRQFDRAIELYKKICAAEPQNGTPRNELGDLYLKTGNTLDAIQSFSLSAHLYRDFGLTNNAVAVYKKILRHDPNHLDSIWGLAEIRREQGLDAEASAGYMEYLSRADQVPKTATEAFFARALELLSTMADDLEILSRLEEVCRAKDRGEDVARVLIAKARQAHIEGEYEVRDRYVEHAREATEILDSLPAYHDYLEQIGAVDSGSGPVETSGRAAPAVDDTEQTESGLIEIDESIASPEEVASGLVEVDPTLAEPEDDEEGGVGPETRVLDVEAIDLGFDFDAEELEDVLRHNSGETRVAQEPPPAGPEASGSMNLLDEILADGSFDVAEDQQRQVETIAREMQGQIAGDVDAGDFGGQYELGIVYMDMGLFEQAIAALDAAAVGEDYRLGALEMRGTCLLRLGRDTEAMESFRQGLGIEGAPERAYLGLLYGMGCCHEVRGSHDEARKWFERVHAVDPGFLDVAGKLEGSGEPG